MPKFDGVAGRMQSNAEAFSILAFERNAYRQLAGARAIMQRYADAASGDPFRVAVNTLYTVAERAELAAVISLMATLATTLETNYPDAVGYAPPQG